MDRRGFLRLITSAAGIGVVGKALGGSDKPLDYVPPPPWILLVSASFHVVPLTNTTWKITLDYRTDAGCRMESVFYLSGDEAHAVFLRARSLVGRYMGPFCGDGLWPRLLDRQPYSDS